MVFRLVVALALLCGVAHAQGDKPWAAGVSESDQQQALAKYGEANELFEKGNYLEALPVYEQALAHWDHPGIHYNAAVCLINLDRAVEAYEHLQKAMAYGEAPLGKDLYTQGRTYMKALGKQIATLAVTLKTPGAIVKLDGKTLLDAPGTVTRNVLATEPHQIVAEKRDYETETRTITLQGGATTTLVLEMRVKQRGRTERRWARWKPWAVVGASGLLAIAGGILFAQGASSFDDYDAAIASDPSCSDGCAKSEVPADIRALEDRGYTRRNAGIGAFVAGGVTLGAGLLLVVLNQPRLVGGTVSPTIGKEHAGATLSWAW